MSRNATVSGGQVGQTLEIQVEFTGADCVPGDKWRLSAVGVTLAPTAAQEIPLGTTSHTLTWKSATPLPAGLASPVIVELRKEHGAGAGPTAVQMITVTIAPAAPAPAAAPAVATVAPLANPTAPAAIPQPLQVQIVGAASATPAASRWINGAGTMGWLGGLVIFLVVLAFLWIVLKVITPTAINGLSGGISAVPAGQSVVVTEVKQTTVSTDQAVLQEATKASATISH